MFNYLGNMIPYEKELAIDNKLHNYLKITRILNNVFTLQNFFGGENFHFRQIFPFWIEKSTPKSHLTEEENRRLFTLLSNQRYCVVQTAKAGLQFGSSCAVQETKHTILWHFYNKKSSIVFISELTSLLHLAAVSEILNTTYLLCCLLSQLRCLHAEWCNTAGYYELSRKRLHGNSLERFYSMCIFFTFYSFFFHLSFPHWFSTSCPSVTWTTGTILISQYTSQWKMMRIHRLVGRKSTVGTASCYGMGGAGIESRCRRDFPYPPDFLYNGHCLFPGGRGKATRRGVENPLHLAPRLSKE